MTTATYETLNQAITANGLEVGSPAAAFAESCYDNNFSNAQPLENALAEWPDADPSDCNAFGITVDEWRAAVTAAAEFIRSEVANA